MTVFELLSKIKSGLIITIHVKIKNKSSFTCTINSMILEDIKNWKVID